MRRAILGPTLSRRVIISGGIPNFEDSPQRSTSEADEIARLLKESTETSKVEYLLEAKATNMLENVTFSLALLKPYAGGSLAFLGKSHGLTRYGATLRRFFPESQLVALAFNADFGKTTLSRDNWRENTETRARVWG